MDIIDFHIHPFIDEPTNVCMYRNTVSDWKQIKRDFRKCGISKVCGSVIPKKKLEKVESFTEVKSLNDEALALRDIFNGFYIPGVHIHPNFVKESCDELERVHNKGVRLVGELVPYFMGWENYFDDNMKEIYDCIDKLNMVVSVHTMSEETLEQAVKLFPNITFVAAHPGDKNTFFRHLERIKKYPNYYLDFSGTGIFRYGLIKFGVEQVGSERFLFGTDYPICNPKMYVSCVEFENISLEDKENIFFNNAKNILKIN